MQIICSNNDDFMMMVKEMIMKMNTIIIKDDDGYDNVERMNVIKDYMMKKSLFC
jgi:hypothetical protein